MPNHYMDPPETPEPPECCGEYMEYDEQKNTMNCETCGKVVEDKKDDIDPSCYVDFELPKDFWKKENTTGYATGDICPEPECLEHPPLDFDEGEHETRMYPGQSPALYCKCCGFETKNFDDSRMNWEQMQ